MGEAREAEYYAEQAMQVEPFMADGRPMGGMYDNRANWQHD